MDITANRGAGVSWDQLPAAITTYLPAHQANDTKTAIGPFAADAVVTDEGRTYRGRDEIEAWMSRSSSEYTFTTEFAGATQDGATRWDVVQHLAGDFPGGEVDLHYRFVLDGDRITGLVIEP